MPFDEEKDWGSHALQSGYYGKGNSFSGNIYDPTELGGYTGTFENGQRVSSSVDDVRNRFRSMAELAAARKAYQANFGGVQANMDQAAQVRNQQQYATNLLGQSAMGNAPSGAAIRGGVVADQSLLSGLSQSAGARSSMAQIAAARQGIQGMQGAQLAGQGQALGARAGELSQARDAYMGSAAAMRAGDYQAQGIYQQQAEARAQAENAQRQLNQQAQMGYEQMGYDATAFDSNKKIRDHQMAAGQYSFDSGIANIQEDRQLRMLGATASSVGAGMSAAVSGAREDARYENPRSDERTKADVLPLADAPDGGALRVSLDGRGYYAEPSKSIQDLTGGASLSGGGTPAMAPQASAGEPGRKPERRMSMAELARWADRETAKTREATARIPSERTAVAPRRDMGSALASGLRPFEYSYKPGFAEAEGQTPSERNVGPMAQDMAANPVTASAVKRGPDGVLYIDGAKAQKLSLGAIGYLAAKQKQQEQELAMLKRGRR